MNDGKITLNETLNQNNLSEIIKGLSYHIALEFMEYLNDEYDGQDEWDYTIKDGENNLFTLKIQLSDWDINYQKKVIE